MNPTYENLDEEFENLSNIIDSIGTISMPLEAYQDLVELRRNANTFINKVESGYYDE